MGPPDPRDPLVGGCLYAVAVYLAVPALIILVVVVPILAIIGLFT